MSDTPDTPPAVETREIALVYAGRVAVQDGKIGAKFLEVDARDQLGKERLYEMGKDLRHLVVGSVYAVQATATAIYTNTFRFERAFGDRPQVAAWQIADRAIDVAKQQRRLEQDVKKIAADLLGPLREVYLNTNFDGRLAIEALVLSYLRRGV